MKVAELKSKVAAFGRWYHSIKLPCEDGVVVTPGEPYGREWDLIRSVRKGVDYAGKTVLDIGTMDGMWAFEAEGLGATTVIATDANWDPIQRFLFCREVLGSKVVPFFNVPLHELARRLDVYRQGAPVKWETHEFLSSDPRTKCAPIESIKSPMFDIVQILGVLYHMRDPLQALLQCRSVMRDGGTLLLETAYLARRTEPVMMFNPSKAFTVYDDITTWWAPSIPALEEMLISSCFKMESCLSLHKEQGASISRIAVTARAVPLDECDPRLVAELRNTHRTPGLEL